MCQQGPTWAPWMDEKPTPKPAQQAPDGARALEVLTQGEWVLYPLSIAKEAAERGWPMRYLVPAREQQEPVALLKSLGPKPWETSEAAHAQTKLILDFQEAFARPPAREPLSPQRLQGLIGDAAVLIGKEFEEDFFAACAKLIRMTEAAHRIGEKK